MSLETTEAQDVAKIYVSGQTTKKRNTSAPKWIQNIYKLVQRQAVINVSESQDSANIEVVQVPDIVVFAQENKDGVQIISRAKLLTEFNLSENTDGIKADEEEFKRIVADRYAQYEQEQIIAIMNAA